jgi:hypothetical protein
MRSQMGACQLLIWLGCPEGYWAATVKVSLVSRRPNAPSAAAVRSPNST